MSSHLHLDFETRSVLDLKKCGADVYARHPSTQVMAIGYAFDDEEVRVLELAEEIPDKIINHVRSGKTVIAHNAHFEWLIWNYALHKSTKKFLPPLKIQQMICTMVRCYAMGLPGSLEKASAALGIDDKKDLKGGRVMLQLSQPRELLNNEPVWWSPIANEDKYQRMYAYCAQDIIVERQIFKRTLKLSDQEQEMWVLDHKINQTGIKVDLESAVKAVEIVKFEQQRLNEEIRHVTKNQVATTNANAQLAAWLRTRGVETSGVAKSDVTDLLEKQTLPGDCRRALEIRQEAAKSSTAKFSALVDRSGTDQRLRSTLQYYGAGTGRWAGRGFQVHNLPRPKLKEDEIEGVFNVLLRN